MKQNSTVLANAVKRTWVRLALTSGSVVLFSQVYFSTIGDGFRISATPVIYPILLIRLGSDRRCPLAGAVTFLTVLIVRCIIACMQGSAQPAALLQEYHGGLFYFCYDAILCLLISDRRAVRPPRLLASLFLCDMASNLLDFMVSGHHLLLFTADRSAAARIVGIGFALALSRALAASTVLWFLSLREQALIHQQESARYQQLFVMAADLKTELYFLKKDAEDIEKVTLKAYQIYEQLCALPEQKALAALSLSVARDMHEIKKDNLRIIRGLESEVQGAYDQREMSLKNLLHLLTVSTNQMLGIQQSDIRLVCRCEEDMIVREHYQLLSILKNLVMNAVEAIQSGTGHGVVEVDCRIEEKHLLICVKDDGPGIAPRVLPHLFRLGYSTKFNSQTGDINRGVGLPAVKAIAEELGGEVSVIPDVADGATFCVRLSLELLKGGSNENLHH